MTEIRGMSAVSMLAGIESGEFSKTEIAKACLSLAKQASDLNCFISLDEESILKKASELESSASKVALSGVPVAVKDILTTREGFTTCGSKMLESFRSPYDATSVAKLKENQALLFGKTNLDEFAMGSSNENSAFGPVRNPWNKECVSGGSSGGSAAAVAAGVVPVALGTDTGGSVRQPASLCGVVGLKPTYGRVSRYGLVAFASSLDQVGVFARSVEDCALVSECMFGWDEKDSTSVKVEVPKFLEELRLATGDLSGLRVGVPKEYFVAGIAPEVAEAVQSAIKHLESLGAVVKEISLPHTELALSVYYIIAPAEAASNLARFDGIRYTYRAKDAKSLDDLYAKSREIGFGAEVKRRIIIGTYVLSSGLYDAYYLKAQKVRNLIVQDFKQVFASECDVIACPVSPVTAFKIGDKVSDPLAMYLTDVFTIPVNLAGLPGISVPCGFDSKKLPIGLQLIGKPFDEATLFRVAKAYEQDHSWHKTYPKI